jgi:hypothetical protein
MEGQVQTLPTSQVPQKKNKPQILAIALFVIFLVITIYYGNIYSKQASQAEELTNMFSEYLLNDQYAQAYDILLSLEEQGLGIHLKVTQASLDRSLALKIADITLAILNEKGKDFTTYHQGSGIQLFKDYPGMIEAVDNQLQKTTGEYLSNSIEYSQIEYFFQNMQMFGFSGKVLEESKIIAERCRESRENVRVGKEFFAEGNYLGALENFTKVTDEDQANYEIAQIGLNQSLTNFYSQIDKLSSRSLYTNATENLKKLQMLFPEKDQEISKKIASLELARQEEGKNLVPYNGSIQHIFFHPLIAYPELAFDGDFQARGFNEWFVTIPEFKKIIKSLYSQGFILVNITDLYEIEKVGDKETIIPKQLHLPEGKRPMIISIDDLNYYRYMVQNGTVHKLILDKEGKVATYSQSLKGEEVIAYDNEIVPILDSFVEEHPDFSFRGAKGVIALTGYEGILGYRTDETELPEFEKEKEEALKVVQVLKDTGWLFASHSQGHLNVREDSYDRVVRDTQRWQREVESLIGPTDVYIYPFGASVKPEDPKFKFLQEAGFKVFCSVGPNPYLKYSEQHILMDRRHIDGLALFQQAESLRDLFVSEEILDPLRPPF